MVSCRKFAATIIVFCLCLCGAYPDATCARTDQKISVDNLLGLAAKLSGTERQLCLDAARYFDIFSVIYPYDSQKIPRFKPQSLIDWVVKSAESKDFAEGCPITCEEEQLVVKLCDAHLPTADIQQLIDDRFSNEDDPDTASYQFYSQHMRKYVTSEDHVSALKAWLANYSASELKRRVTLVKTIVVQACELPDADKTVSGVVAEKLAKNPLFTALQSGGLSFTFALHKDGSMSDLIVDHDGASAQGSKLNVHAKKSKSQDETQSIAAMIKKSAPFKLVRFSAKNTPITVSFFWNSMPTKSIVADAKPSVINWIGITINNVGQVPHDALLQVAKTFAQSWNPSGRWTSQDDISADFFVYADDSVAQEGRASDPDVSPIFNEKFPVLHPAPKTSSPVATGNQQQFTKSGIPIPKGAKIPRERMDIHASFGRTD
jgi:hypothetical protein